MVRHAATSAALPVLKNIQREDSSLADPAPKVGACKGLKGRRFILLNFGNSTTICALPVLKNISREDAPLADPTPKVRQRAQMVYKGLRGRRFSQLAFDNLTKPSADFDGQER